MNEFDAPQEHGVKQMRETIDRKDESIKKLEAELASYKDKEIDNVFSSLGLSTDKGFGKALKQVYDGPIDTESIAQFAKDEYGYESTGQVQEVTQPAPEPIVQDDARERVAALDANSVSDVPLSQNEELAKALQSASVKDSLRARLAIMEQDKQNK
jgi:folylpolyglutamate synthase/dihydropteroate synthase|tara:strand:- start:554 stop:1021 length:468 start_codon:yes stop_codon:yes gene_type:complete